jgi:hypothetical protein
MGYPMDVVAMTKPLSPVIFTEDRLFQPWQQKNPLKSIYPLLDGNENSTQSSNKK